MARYLIKPTIFQELSTSSDYRVHLKRITNVANDYGQLDDVILNTAISKVTKKTSNGIIEFPIEQCVVYLNKNQYSLVVWDGISTEAIGSSSSNYDTDSWSTGTYIITTDIPQNVVLNDQSTLIFEGGKFLAGLMGNNTAIQAPPVRTFGDDINLSGSFVNKSAYPEWWGAVPSSINFHTLPLTHNTADNSQYIQRAFDSCFGEIEFCCGNYYVENTITLRKMKTIKMQGLGLRTNSSLPNDFTTVLWTDKNINVLKIEIPDEQVKNGRLLIEGGEINVSKCKGDAVLHYNVWINNIDTPSCYTEDAILFNPSGEWGGKISISIVGPIPWIGRSNGAINWNNHNCHCPTVDEMRNNYKGTGIRFVDISQASIQHHWTYVFTLDCFIIGFGHGIVVDYDTDLADMTSLHIYGVIDQCFTYVNAPSRALNGGVLECTIQTRSFNAPDGYNQPLIQGNFVNAYINPYIWDLHQDVDFFDFNENTKNVSFGPRVISVMNSIYRRKGMSIKNLASIVSSNQSNMLGSMGNFDTQQLSAINTVTQSENYTHFIDNDLLGIDRIFNVKCDVTPDGFSDDNEVQHSSSLFDRGGMSFTFPDTEDNDDAKLTIECDLSHSNTGFPINSTKVQILAIHLKGDTFYYFENLKVTVNDVVYFDGPYANIPLVQGLNDIIIPFMKRYNYDQSSATYAIDNFLLGKIKLEFEKLRAGYYIWSSEKFKVAIEGRLNRHFKNNVWSAAGGDLGNHIMLKGKPYIVGTGDYTSLSSLPTDASIGAIAVVNDSYPVVKTSQGWIIQNLSGTLSGLQALNSSIGPMTAGQMALATNLNKIVFWDGNSHWYDAMGNQI